MKGGLIYVLLFVACALAEDLSSSSEDVLVECNSPFQLIGGRCLFVETTTSASWDDVRLMCQFFKGDLVKLDSIEVMGAIIDFINENNYPNSGYWVGASDLGNEGSWTWTDGTAVRMGMPLWNQCTSHQPDGGSGENCAIMSSGSCFLLNDVACSSAYFGVCETG